MSKERKYPDERECLKLLQEHHILPNILAHSQQVKNVSLLIAANLKEGTEIDRELVRASALLHDIAKSRSIKSGDYRHDITGGRILREIGYEDLARVVERHIFLKGFREEGPLEEWEIVHYADKRVMHDKVVTIDERIDDLVRRYNLDKLEDNFIRKSREMIHRLEGKIDRHMKIEIDDALTGL